MKHRKFNEIYPYTYYIRRKSDGLQYHGVRIHNIKLKLSPTEDFGIKYFSSGKFKKEFKLTPQNFEWKIKWTFDDKNEAILHEQKINKKIYKKNLWLNACANYIPVESSKISRKKSLLEKYGVEYASQHESVKKQFKKTCLEKYGVDNISKLKEIKEKKKQTMLKRYGVETSFDLIDLKNSYINKFGVDNPLKSKKIQNKVIQTNLKKYGVKYTFQSKDVINKIHQKRKEMYIKLAQMSDEDFLNYLKSISQHPAIQAQKKSQRIKGMKIYG